MRRRGILFVLWVLAGNNAFAQYTAQVLPPPREVPANQFSYTSAYAVNNKGQVFGRAGNFAGGSFYPVGPVLWTDGVPAWMPLPTGYRWHDASGMHFMNESGTVVSAVQDTRVTSGGLRPVVWRIGTAGSCVHQHTGRLQRGGPCNAGCMQQRLEVGRQRVRPAPPACARARVYRTGERRAAGRESSER
jgi:hypothetical protein